LGKVSGPSRGALDSIDLLARGGSEQLRQGFRAVVTTELRCVGTKEEQSYRFTATRTDLEALRSQTATMAGIDPSLGKRSRTVVISSRQELDGAVRANLAALMGRSSVYFGNATPETVFDARQEHVAIGTVPRDAPKGSRWALRLTVLRGGRSKKERSERSTRERRSNEPAKKSAATAPVKGALLEQIIPIDDLATEHTGRLVIQPHELDPGTYVANAEVVECGDGNKCDPKGVASSTSREFTVLNRTLAPWARVLLGGSVTRQSETAFFLHAGLGITSRRSRTLSLSPFVGYGLRIIERRSPPTWDSVSSPEVTGDPQGVLTYGWLRHSANIGLNTFVLFPIDRNITMQFEGAVFADLAVSNSSRIPRAYADALSGNARGDHVFDLDASVLLGGKLTYEGFSVGGGLLVANVVDLVARALPDNGARQSLTEGGNLLVTLHIGYGGPR
jgi:hypothetical protein